MLAQYLDKILIRFKDGENWTSLAGIVTYWADYSTHYKPGRIVPSFLAPTKILDNWNGVDFDVQHLRWEGYFIEFNIRESEIQILNRITGATEAEISDLQRNIVHTPDLTLTDYFTLDIAPVADTTTAKVRLSYRTNRTIVNYANRVGASPYEILCENGTPAEDKTYQTKFEFIFSQLDTQRDIFDNGGGIDTVTKAIAKQTISALLYLDETTANEFKKVVETYPTITLTKPDLTAYVLLEPAGVTVSPVGIGLYKCILAGTVEVEQTYYK